ncbi:hypothetical protein [uncultured Roseovarius sp.]|nr:hypothetical protein [uncultured Roseovarius sp.]
MRARENPVLGVDAPPARPTVLAAFLLAVMLSVPVGLGLTLLDWLVLN